VSAAQQPYQLLPPLTEDEYAALKADIAENGVMVPVEIDEDGNLLDGHHRAAIAAELGIDYPTVLRAGLTEDQKHAHALRLNLQRRHLSAEQKRELILAELERNPDRSDRAIAKLIGVDHKTVGKIRGWVNEANATAESDRGGEIPHSWRDGDLTNGHLTDDPVYAVMRSPAELAQDLYISLTDADAKTDTGHWIFCEDLGDAGMDVTRALDSFSKEAHADLDLLRDQQRAQFAARVDEWHRKGLTVAAEAGEKFAAATAGVSTERTVQVGEVDKPGDPGYADFVEVDRSEQPEPAGGEHAKDAYTRSDFDADISALEASASRATRSTGGNR
jgi:hypothetical protein